MTERVLESIEIYPHIRVYKNMFKDISKSYKILTDSLVETEDRVFSPWTQWSIFGEYLDPITPSFRMNDDYGNLKLMSITILFLCGDGLEEQLENTI
jgi:hypothetical protein